MKKILYSVALAALALVASCQREVGQKELAPADFATVTFSIDAAQPGTKASADGLTATKLYAGVYDVTAESKFMGDISELGTLTLAAGKYDFSVRLVKGQSYKLVFWAQAPDAPYAVTIGQAGATVVATTTGAGSAENRDAFFKTVETGVVGEDFALPVKLERAVAQVNVIANDWAEASAAGVTYTGASMSIAGLPDTIDLLTGTYSGSATYSFASAAAPADLFGDKKWIASNYVFAADEEGLKAVEFVVDGAVNGAAKQWIYAEADKVNNVAITRNYRTNIFGNLFTASATFNVVVDPIFATPDNEKELEIVKDVTAINSSLDNNKEVTGPAAYVIETVKADDTTIIIPDGTQASDLTFTIASFEATPAAPSLTINDGGVTAAYAGNITINLPADTDVNLVTINAPGAHVVISNGTITKVVAATSGTTLVVGDAAKIGHLEIGSGNVQISGEVGTIVRAEGNTDEVTYVSLVEGYKWTNQATDTADGTKVVIKVDDPSEEPSEDPSEEPDYQFTSIAELNVLSNAENGTYSGKLSDVVVTYVNGKNAFIKDATASALIFKANHGLKQGQTFSGEITVTTSIYNGLAELTDIGEAAFEGEGEVIDPETVSIEDLAAEGGYATYQNAYVKVENVEVQSVSGKNVSVKAGEGSYTIFDGANAFAANLKAGDLLTAIGTVTIFNTTEELKVWSGDDVSVTPATETSEDPSTEPSEDPSGEPDYQFTTIAELNALLTATSAEYKGKLTDAVVSYVQGKNAIIKDATGSILYFKDSHGLLQGQTFSGDVTVSGLIYNNNYTELTAIDATFEGSGAVVEPEVLTLAQLTAEGAYAKYQNTYAKIVGVTSKTTTTAKGNITVTDGSIDYVVYTNVAIPVNTGDVLTAVGTITKYNTTEEIKVWAAADLTITSTTNPSEDPSTDPSTDPSDDPVQGNEVTIDLAAQGYENAQTIESLTVGGVTLTFDKGSNSSNVPKYYNTGTAVRLYAGNSMTVSAQKAVTGVKLTFSSGEGSNAISTDVGTFDTDTWTGSSTSVVFTVSGTSGHRRLAKAVVTLAE